MRQPLMLSDEEMIIPGSPMTGLAAGSHVNFLEDIIEMGLDRVLTHTEPVSNLFITGSGSNLEQYLFFPGSERRGGVGIASQVGFVSQDELRHDTPGKPHLPLDNGLDPLDQKYRHIIFVKNAIQPFGNEYRAVSIGGVDIKQGDHALIGVKIEQAAQPVIKTFTVNIETVPKDDLLTISGMSENLMPLLRHDAQTGNACFFFHERRQQLSLKIRTAYNVYAVI